MNPCLFCVSIYLNDVFLHFFISSSQINRVSTVVFIDTKRIGTNWTIAKQWSDNIDKNKKNWVRWCHLVRWMYDVFNTSLESIEWKWEYAYITYVCCNIFPNDWHRNRFHWSHTLVHIDFIFFDIFTSHSIFVLINPISVMVDGKWLPSCVSKIWNSGWKPQHGNHWQSEKWNFILYSRVATILKSNFEKPKV